MANTDEPGPSSRQLPNPNPFVNEHAKVFLDKSLKILKEFMASNDLVYVFHGLAGKERNEVDRLCHLMGLGVRFCGRTANERKIFVYKMNNEASDQIRAILSKKRKNREEPESYGEKKEINDELNKVWISQTLGKFLASNDEVYNFETKLSREECALVHKFCEKKGFIYTLSWDGIKPRVSIHKTRDVDNTTLIENLPHVTCSAESDLVDMLKKSQKKEERESLQHQNFIVIDSKRVQISQILEKFLASKDEVYNFEDGLSTKDRALVVQLSKKMGLSCTFYGRGNRKKTSVHKTKKEVDTTKVLGSLPHVTFSEESNQNKKEPEPPQHQNPIFDESTRIQISQTLENFLASKDQVYNFEANLSPEECVAVHQLSQKMGLRVETSGSWIKQKVSVHKIEKKIHTATKLENLPCFTFSEESKQVLGDLLMHYPPGDEELWGEMIGACSDTMDRTKQKEDDFFSRPYTSKVEITKKLEDLSTRMKNPSDLKLINEKRSKLPIASFKDFITSTVESHQVVIICGETGCGKTTQVPQYILDHMWGKGEVCKIVCTQPQCFSVTSVSKRISSERGEAIGNSVGYKIRFETRGGRHSSIVLCTTEVLLKVLLSTGSHFLKTRSVKDDISSISHIIMDEIHERDRYSDLMLAILREMLPSNPHLRLILMSASVDAARFSQYFGVCPIIYVPGPTFPVKTYYLEDVLSIVKYRADNHLDNNHELSQVEKLSLDEAINLAWFNDEWCSLLELVYSKASPKVFDYQHSLTGLNPLMVFAGKGKVGDMCMLLSLGANCYLRAKDGTTALEIAEKENQQVAIELLKKHMDNDFSNEEGENLLDKYLATVDPKVVDVVLIEQLIRKISIDSNDGGIIVFLPGWDEIIRIRERLLASPFFNKRSKFRVISLHSMVPAMEQTQVFMSPPNGCRKIVLSTNIAETAVTLDDIVYVIDTGLVKEKSYDPYNNVLTLQSSWISKASAKQREGCASRCQPGICYRLYSKVQAASLPDFQVPEIKRMPIEELCLQVKLLDPSCKIEEFLSRTFDPPGFVSIRNAVGVLQEIGALSVDEQLTRLGEKLGSLPVHPSTSRMLLFSILMNCLDPALTLACASECSDLFVLPISPDEKERAAAARSEFASLYGACGDQLAIIAAFECWHNSKNMGLESRFCSRYFISQSTMNKLCGMRKNLVTQLYRNGLIRGCVSSYCSNAHDPGILQAVLVAGMYPMVGKLFFPYESGKKFVVKTKSGDNVYWNNHSVNSKLSSQRSFDCSLVVYDEITSSDWGMCARKCTVVGLLPLFLFSKEIAVAPAKDCTEGDEFMSSPDNIVRVIIDRWLCFESTALDTSEMNYLRERLSAAISHKVTHSTDVLPPLLQAAVDALACILSCHGLSCITQTSDRANTLTTTINATNPKEFQTELINQDAHQTNPSKVKVFEPEAIENPSNHTSQNAPIDLACSTPTNQTDKTPEGFCTGLINHNDVPSSGTSVSTSNGAENPSDPTSQNTATGSNGGRYQMIAIEWIFPEVGWIKANVDGSYRHYIHHSSCAGVFRDSTGSWCFGFVLNLGALSCGSSDSAIVCPDQFIMLSELWGILTALKLAREKGISQLWIETDCSLAVKCILNRRVENGDRFAPIVQSILEFMEGNWTVRISNCYREGNRVADWLTRYAHSMELGLHVLDVPPPGCVKYLTDDCAGVYRLRTVRVSD
ncbi:ATP-dependent RNA helicase YTHDC2 [Spatholobus suberectus]|nr:ATP-dependent RNA helicase YTHDC2 [Spatholobus suberectus]